MKRAGSDGSQAPIQRRRSEDGGRQAPVEIDSLRGQAQGQVQGQVQAQEAQQILPQPGATAAIPVQASSEPSLAARKVLSEVAGMPDGIWKIILSKLDEVDLARLTQVCYSFSDYAAGLHLQPLDVDSTLAQTQRSAVRSAQYSLLESYLRLRNTGMMNAPDANLQEQFGNTLTKLAARYRCLDIPLVQGFENVVLDALANTSRWQNLRLHLGSAVLPILSRLAPLFEENFSRPARTIDLYLSLPGPENLAETVRLAKDLPLRALVIDFDYSQTEVSYGQLHALGSLLSSQNQIQTLKIYAHDAADLLLSWLKAGTPKLQRLGLAQLPGTQALTALLNDRPELKALDLSSEDEEQLDLPIASLLTASPGLERLKLTDLDLSASSSQGCAQAFKNSTLREFGFVTCSLSNRVRSLDSLRVTHEELMTGLSSAPFLSVLEVSIIENMKGLAKLEIPACQLVLEGFGDNPAARTVRKVGFEGDNDKVVACVKQINVKREAKNYIPLEIKYLPVQGKGVDDEDDASSFLFKTVREMFGGEDAIAELVSGITDPDEFLQLMNEIDGDLLGMLEEQETGSDDDV